MISLTNNFSTLFLLFFFFLLHIVGVLLVFQFKNIYTYSARHWGYYFKSMPVNLARPALTNESKPVNMLITMYVAVYTNK